MVAAVLCAPCIARADTIVYGSVVKVEPGEIYVNLGANDEVDDGARLRLKRKIKLRHPVTRAWVSDWLPIGAADVTDAGQQLSRAVLDDTLFAAVAVGDIAEVYVERDDSVPDAPDEPEPVDPTPDPGGPLPEVDAETQAVLAVWTATKDAGVQARIAAWEGYLAANVDSPYGDVIREDLVVLRRNLEIVTPASATATREVGGVSHDAPKRAEPGTPIPLVFVLDEPDDVASAWLHFRATDDQTFTRVLLTREGGRYLRGDLPASIVTAPGVEYFLEVVSPSGEAGVAITNQIVEVEKPEVAARFEPERNRTSVSSSVLFLDFATFDDNPEAQRDRYVQIESDVAYRLDGDLVQLGAGFGLIDGDTGATHAGFEYGYAEAESAPRPYLGLAGRLIAGVGRRGLGLGVEARARIGPRDGTNLSLSASTLSEIGFLTQVRFEIDPFGKAPIGLSAGVTDQPTGGDLAVRLGVDVGVRTLSWLEPVLRLSYQGRTVEHSGIGAGLGLDFHW